MERCLVRCLKTPYIFILFALLLAACTTETGRTLRHADSVMEEYPDSAMTILSGIDRRTLKDSDLPYFALLYTQAQVKTDVPLDSDSLISIAYSKYGDKTNGDLGIRSNFYTGEVFFNRKEYREAMPYYLTAYEESKRLGNDYWHAKAAERISDLFFFAYNYDEATQYAQEAADLFKLAGRQLNHRYSLAQLANVMLNNGDYDRAYVLLDSLQTLVERSFPVDSAFLQYIRMPMIDAMMKTRKIDVIEMDSFDYMKKESSVYELFDATILQSRLCRAKGSPDKMQEILDGMDCIADSDEDRIHLLYAQYENAKAMGNSILAFSLVDSMLYYENALAEDILQESVTAAQRDFYSELSLRHERRSRFLKWILCVSIIVFVLIVVFIATIAIFRSKTQKAKLEANLEAFLSIKEYSDRMSRENEDLGQLVRKMDSENNSIVTQMRALQNEKLQEEISHAVIVEKLFKDRWTTIDTLCDQYFGLNNSELSAKDLVSNMEKELKKIVSKKGLSEIVDSVDTYMGGIVTDLRNQCPFLKDEDVSFLALLYAGFSVRAVCMFIGIKYTNFYVRKSRLVKRIQASDAPDKSLFLEKLK